MRGHRTWRSWAALRDATLARDAYLCVACGSPADLAVDHVIPRVQGGPDTLDNLQTLCRTCHSEKTKRQR